MSASNAPAPSGEELGRVAAALGTDEGLIEKDWHVVKALAVLSRLAWKGSARLVFCGGTSLSKGWGLISRFSEDIDFRLRFDGGQVPRTLCRAVREDVRSALAGAGFVEVPNSLKVRNGSQFAEVHFGYGGSRPVPHGLRAEIKVELTMEQPRLPPVGKSVASFVSRARGHSPEMADIPCLDPVEIAAEKLSAFAWRACNRSRGGEGDDPAIVRHLYDLAALYRDVSPNASFYGLACQSMAKDAGRGKAVRPTAPSALLAHLVALIEADSFWAQEYDSYIHEVSYGPISDLPSFDAALSMLRRYGEMFQTEPG